MTADTNNVYIAIYTLDQCSEENTDSFTYITQKLYCIILNYDTVIQLSVLLVVIVI